MILDPARVSMADRADYVDISAVTSKLPRLSSFLVLR